MATTLPNALIIGAQKSGTTSLYHYFRQHPQIYMSPEKEPHFFSYEGYQSPDNRIITDIDTYKTLFFNVGGALAIGEASPSYLHSTQAPQRIAHYIPSARLIAILRDPAERAFSSYLHNFSKGYENYSFMEALSMESGRCREPEDYLFWYRYKGFYFKHLCRYLGFFPIEQMHLILFDDLQNNPDKIIRSAYKFLGVEENFHPSIEKHNVSGLPNGIVGRAFNSLRRNKKAASISKRIIPEVVRIWARNLLLTRPQLDLEIRKELIDGYREDILQLQDLLQRDLSSWLK